MEKNIVKSRLTCPKCKSSDLFLIELWKDAGIHWEQLNGEFDRQDGALEPGGPHAVEAECKHCKHRWRVAKASQIDDLIKN